MTNLKSPPNEVLFNKMEAKYKQLMERAYNHKQTDDSLSDIFYFEADQVLQKLNTLKNDLTLA
ncbi:MAG: hypothetical protein CVU03_05525 [Bacteroidetes bacterium HGW-Bacteroidetes-2]|jgi:hypothetical protein|nr:MAG: hypothetical protein CVU03_05525 [Bacteroidetes bacterium HGW-Bacteroidetes-2]